MHFPSSTMWRIDSVMAELNFLCLFFGCAYKYCSDASSSSSHNTNNMMESLFVETTAAAKEFTRYLQHVFIDRFTDWHYLEFTTKLVNLGKSARHPFRSKHSELRHIFTSLNQKIWVLKPKIKEAYKKGGFLSTQSFHPPLRSFERKSYHWNRFCRILEWNMQYLSQEKSSYLSDHLWNQMKTSERSLNSIDWLLNRDFTSQHRKDKMKAHFGEMVIQVARLCCLCWYNAPVDQSTQRDIAILLEDLHLKMDPAPAEFREIILRCLGHNRKDSQGWHGRNLIHDIIGYEFNREVLHNELLYLLTCVTEIPEMHSMDMHRILVGVKDVVLEARYLKGKNKRKHKTHYAILFAKIWSLKAEIFIKVRGTFPTLYMDKHVEALRRGYRFLEEIFSPTNEKSVEYQILALIRKLPEQVLSLYQSSRAEDYLVYNNVCNLLLKSLVHVMLLEGKALLLELLKKDSSLMLPLKHHIEALHEALRFLIDSEINQPKEITGDEKLILTDIEVVVSGVISICYTFLAGKVTTEAIKIVEIRLSDLFEKVQHLKAKLKGLYLQNLKFNLPRIPGLCFIELLLQNLRKLLTHKQDSVAYETHQIEAICKDLEFIVSRFRDVFEQGIEKQECKDLHTCLVDAAYQVEHVIASMLGENKIVWQHSLWLYHLSEEIRHIKMQLADFDGNNNCDDGVHNAPQRRLMPVASQVTSTAIEEVIVGLNDKKKKIIDRLTRVMAQRDIVSIVGMPGIGKTTLANNVFSSSSVMYHFPIRAWCCVSQKYKNRDLLLDILSHIIIVTDNIHEMSDADLAELLRKQLKGKRYLVIMDDMWSTEAWDDLQLSFPDDLNGSRILLTSRLHAVISKISDPITLRPLSKEQSWELLKLKTFQKEECPGELTEIGQQIAKNCKGLPLAICAIAGLLDKTNKNQGSWKQIAESVSSRIVKDPEMQCKEILELSYKHLPDHLKACFLYFGAFPEDKVIPVQRLQWLWIAEGFVHKLESKSMEDLAEDYLMDLVGRSLVIVAKRRSNGEVKACRVHDVVRDLCLLKAKDERFLQLISANDEPYSSFNSLDYGVHYELFNPSDYVTYKEYRLCFCVNREQFIASRPFGPFVRSIQIFATTDMYPRCPYDVSFIPNNYKCLRVLDLESINMGYSLANGIESLVDLIYLAVSGDMEFIPTSLSNLQNLETLLVKALRSKVVLPDSIWRMKKLRHVHVTSHAIFTLPNDESGSYSQLDSLVTLSLPSFTCGERINNIKMRLPQLRELRCIFLEPRDVSLSRYHFPALESLRKLESLKISYYGKALCTDELNLPSSLKKLTLSNFRLPWNHISAIGRLQNLEVLKLISRAFEGSSWNMTERGFLKLKYLELDTLNVVSWIASSDHLPQLQQLLLRNCKQLEEVPFDFVSISTLQRIEVQQCGISVDESVKRIEEFEIEGLKIFINNSHST